MKKLLLCQLLWVVGASTACTSLGSSGGSSYRESTLSNANPAPQKLAPPDYSAANTNPMTDGTFLSSQADYHFTMGETLSYEGQSPKAIEEFKATLIYDTKSIHVRLRLAAEYVRMGMVTEAVEQGEVAVEMAPKSIEARMLLGGLYTGLKMFDPARAQFNEVLKIEPGHPEASVYLGALLAEQKKYDESIKYFESLAQNPKFKETEKAYYYIGRVRAEQGKDQFANAEKALGKALTLRPDFPEATLALAILMRAQKREADMERLLRTFQEKFGPEHEMARLLSHYYLEKEEFEKALQHLEAVDSFERDNLNVKIQIALILIEQKKYEQAATRLEDVLQQAPDSDKVRYYLGAIYEEVNKFDLALAHYAKIPPASTYFTDATVHSAHMLKTSRKLGKAIALVEGALQKHDENPQIYAFYATLLDEAKEYKKAVQMLKGAVAKFATNTQLRFFLGTMQDRVGNTSETVIQMKTVIAQDKDHVQALNYLAYTYAELGNELEHAQQMAQHALELQPNDGYILDTLGWVNFKMGNIEDAIRLLEAAHRLKGDEAIIAEHLGDAYIRHQMWQKAQKMYRRAAELERDMNNSHKLRQKIANVESQSQQTSRSPASVP